MAPNFFEVLAKYLESSDSLEDSYKQVEQILDEEGRRVYAQELRAISHLAQRE